MAKINPNGLKLIIIGWKTEHTDFPCPSTRIIIPSMLDLKECLYSFLTLPLYSWYVVGVLLQQDGLDPFHAINNICSVQPGHPLRPYGVSNAQHDGDSLHLHHEDTLCVKPSIQLHRNLLTRAAILHLIHLLLGHPQHVYLEHAQENCCQLAGIFGFN